MPYTATIIDTKTGEEREYVTEWDFFHDGEYDDYFWWTEGNFGCDCNRELSFKRAGGENPLGAEDPTGNGFETSCGEGRFYVPYITLPDGKRIPIDDPTPDCSKCDGSLYDFEADSMCKWCDGTGVEPRRGR